MKKYILITLVLLVASPAFAHRLVPDILYYKGKKLRLIPFPAPLQDYFNEYHQENTFYHNSTARYRGYTAHWKIKDDKLYLKKIVANPSPRKTYPVNKRRIIKNDSLIEGTKVFAEWYSGILRCRIYTRDYWLFARVTDHYYFQIRRGKLISTLHMDSSGNMTGNTDLIQMSASYQTIQSAMISYSDRVEYDGKQSLLENHKIVLSPIFAKYGKYQEDFKYSWENTERSGAPKCHWTIRNDSFFLDNMVLIKRISRDSSQIDSINLKEEFNGSTNVFASWYSGAIRIKEGKYEVVNEYTGKQTYYVTKSIYLKIVNGIVVAKYEKKGDLPWSYIYYGYVVIPPELQKVLE